MADNRKPKPIDLTDPNAPPPPPPPPMPPQPGGGGQSPTGANLEGVKNRVAGGSTGQKTATPGKPR